MKKLVLLGLVCSIISTGCSKEISGPEANNNADNPNFTTGGIRAVEANATVAKMAGLGWVLVLENNEIAVPQNLPDAFTVENKKVKVVFFYTNKMVPCKCEVQKFYINIIQIDLIL